MLPFHSLSSIIVAIISLSSFSLAFRTRNRRSGLAGFDDPYALTNALQDMDRERRRSSIQSQIEESILGDDDSYFNPNSISDLDDDYLRSLPYLEQDDVEIPQYFPGYNFDDEFQDVSPLRSYPKVYGGLEERPYGPTKRTAFSPHRVSPSLDQLRDLFGETSIPRKRMAAHQTPNLLEAENEIRNAEEDTRQLAHKLLKQAEKITETESFKQIDGNPPQIVKDVKIEKTNPDGTVKTLEEVFDGAETGDDSSSDTQADNEAETEESEQINTNNDESSGQTKTKRGASSEPCIEQSVYIGELLTEIAMLKDKVTKLEAEQVLEDKENDLLADALVYSTLDQIGGGNDYVDKEYKDISKATETEELIQMIADGGDGEEKYDDVGERLEEYLEPNVVNEDDGFKKRSEEPMEQIQWYDHPVKPSASGGATLLDEDDDDEPTGFIGETPIEIPYPDDDESEEEEEAEEEAEEEEEMEEQEAEREALEMAVDAVQKEVTQENEEADKVAVLKNLLTGLSPDELKELIDELKTGEKLVNLAENNVCPAAVELSDNCAFADVVGIPIDADARSLCIRHQLCYTCGEEIGIPKTGCDEGFKKTAVQQCDGDRNCIRTAVLFLKLMEEYHTYGIYGPQQCSAPCLEEFILNGK